MESHWLPGTSVARRLALPRRTALELQSTVSTSVGPRVMLKDMNCPVVRFWISGDSHGPVIWNTGRLSKSPSFVTVRFPPEEGEPKVSGNTSGNWRPGATAGSVTASTVGAVAYLRGSAATRPSWYWHTVRPAE